MSSASRNLSDYNKNSLPDISGRRFSIIVSEWNHDITEALFQGAFKTLIECGCKPENVTRHDVPGSFELVSGAKIIAERNTSDAIICIGCVVQGETKHFDYICNAVSNGIAQLCTLYPKPFIFGVLTVDNIQQAKDRAGGKHGNKGVEAAIAAIRMVSLI